MAYTDLQRFIRFLEDRQELIRVSTPVDRYLEITEIADRLVKQGGPAVLFENVKGSPFPLVIGLMGTRQRMSWALGAESLDEVADTVRDLIDLKPQAGLKSLGQFSQKLQHLRNLPPKRVKKASVQEVIWRGDEVDLSKLPILHCWPEDGGPFITLPLVISKDPETGEYNMGMYRMQVLDNKSTGMHWQRHKTGARHLEKAKKLGQRLEVAVALGGDPALIYAATAPLPPAPGLNEYLLTGYLRGEPQPVIKGITVDLEVPANAEFILEGYIDPEEAWINEGPFGDHTGFYTLVDRYPRFHVTAITMRKNPVYPATIVGRPPMEDAYLIETSERIFLHAAQLILPEITDYNMPPAGVAHNLVFVAIRKQYPGQAYKVANGLLGLGQMMFAKVIVVVDEDVPVHNFEQVWATVGQQARISQDVLYGRGPTDVLDHSSRTWSYGGKLIIDATRKLPEEMPTLPVGSPNIPNPPQPVQTQATAKTTTKTAPKDAAPILAQHGAYLAVAFEKVRAQQGRELGQHLAAQASPEIVHILITDQQTNPQDIQDVWWTILNNIDPERDVFQVGHCLIWDGSRKRPDEGFSRDWPSKLIMPEHIRERVSHFWHMYGLPDAFNPQS